MDSGPSITNYHHFPDLGNIEDLRKEINELKEREKKKEQIKKDEITMAQQLLLLHYFGLLNEFGQSTKDKSLLLSKILNRSYDNIRKNLTYINSPKISYSKIKNVENLELVLKIFEELSMPEVADKVKVDLKKIKEA